MTGVLVVTGASRGIGEATAVAGAARGYAVCVNYRSDAEKAEAVADLIFELHGQEGALLLLATHHEGLARRCDRVLELRDGRCSEA